MAKLQHLWRPHPTRWKNVHTSAVSWLIESVIVSSSPASALGVPLVTSTVCWELLLEGVEASKSSTSLDSEAPQVAGEEALGTGAHLPCKSEWASMFRALWHQHHSLRLQL